MIIENRSIRDPTPTGFRCDPAHPVLATRVDVPAACRVAPHSHPRAQLLYAVRGLFRIITPQGAWLVPPTQAVWIPSGVRHEVAAAGPVAIRTLFVEPQALTDMPVNCMVANVPHLLRALILEAVAVGEDYPAQGPAQRLMAVILDQLRGLTPSPLHLPLAEDRRLRVIMDALIADPSDPRALAAWAVTAGASTRTLARLFRRHTGMGFDAWRRQLRLLEGVERMERGESVTRVALDLGYRSPSAFVAMFRRAFGVPPTRYLAHDETPASQGQRRGRGRTARRG